MRNMFYQIVQVLFLANFFWLKSCFGKRAVRVTTRNGEIEGRVMNHNRQSFGVYCGIPFAEPPVGRLRFQVGQKKLAEAVETFFVQLGIQFCNSRH